MNAKANTSEGTVIENRLSLPIFIYLRFIILPGQLNLHDLQRFRSDINYKISGTSYFPQIFSGILLEKSAKITLPLMPWVAPICSAITA